MLCGLAHFATLPAAAFQDVRANLLHLFYALLVKTRILPGSSIGKTQRSRRFAQKLGYMYFMTKMLKRRPKSCWHFFTVVFSASVRSSPSDWLTADTPWPHNLGTNVTISFAI